MRADDRTNDHSSDDSKKSPVPIIVAIVVICIIAAIAKNKDDAAAGTEQTASDGDGFVKEAVFSMKLVDKLHSKLTDVQFTQFIGMTHDVMAYAKGTVLNANERQADVDIGNGIVVSAKIASENTRSIIKGQKYLVLGRLESVTNYANPVIHKLVTWADPNFKVRLNIIFSEASMVVADAQLSRFPPEQIKKGEDLIKQRITNAFSEINYE